MKSSLTQTGTGTFGWGAAGRRASISLLVLSKFSASLSTFLFILFLTPPSLRAAEIIVAAAADLSALEQPLAAAYHQATGAGMRFALGSSGMLAQQIAHGAPYDVFLSANQAYVDELVRTGRILPDTVVWYADGRLALWSPSGSIRILQQLDAPKLLHISIANPAHAPYGVAAKQALQSRGLWGRVEKKIVYAENVRQAWEYARGGNVDAALTAWTLVHDQGGVLVPDEWHQPIRQVGGVVTGARQAALARRFLAFLQSADGRAVLQRYGLFPPGAPGRR